MRIVNFILLLMLIPLINFGQDSIPIVAKKIQFSIQAGAYYKTFLGNKYIEPTPYNYGDEFTNHQYERFNKIPTFGFSVGLLFTYRFNQHWGITSGLLYFLRKDIFENNQDTIIKYGNGSTMRDIRNTLKYNYSYYNLEIPFMVNYSQNKFTFNAGCYFSLMSYKKARYSYVVNQYPNSPQWIISDKTIAGFEMPLKIFPTIQVSYKVKIKKMKINPYLAFNYALKNQNDFYIQIGINLPLIKKQNQKSKKKTFKIKNNERKKFTCSSFVCDSIHCIFRTIKS